MKKLRILLVFLLVSGTISSQKLRFNFSDTKKEKEISKFSSDIVYKSNIQVSKDAFKRLIFNDLNFLILGDDSPKQGISYEYEKDNSNLKLSAYLGKLNQSFVTVDGDFATGEGIYFFNSGKLGGSRAKVTLNWFILSDLFFNNNRQFDYLITEDLTTQKYEVNEKRASSYFSNQYAQTDYIINLYIKYKTLSEELLKSNFPYAEVIEKNMDSLREKLKDYNVDPVTLEETYDLKDYKNDKNAVLKGKFEDSDNSSRTTNITVKTEGINLSKVYQDIKILESEIDTLDTYLMNMELEQNEDIWNSKNVFYFGISPYYERQSKEIYTSQFHENNLNYEFNTVRRDVFGINVNYNYFRQLKTTFINRTFVRINLELGRSTNFEDIKLSNINITDSLGTSANKLVTQTLEKKAYTGDLPFAYAFKKGVSLDAYLWIVENFGVFAKLGYNSLDFQVNSLDNSKIPFQTGIMFDVNRHDNKGKLAVIQAFIDRGDVTVAPENNKEELRFGFKIGIPVNLKDSL